MSLYAGIRLSSSNSGAPEAAASSVTAGPGQATTTTAGATEQQLEEEAARYAAAQAEQAAKEQAEAQRKAALAFGPVHRRKPAQAAKPKPATNVLAATSAATLMPSVVTSAPPSLYNSASVDAAPRNSTDAPASTSTGNDSQPGPSGHVLTGRTLVVPPSMTLDGEDINGFRATAAGKKAANKANKKKKKNRKQDDPGLAWEAEYDPARPTDYNEYKAWSKVARAERRAEILRQRRLANGSGTDSDYSGSDIDSDEERRRRIGKANNRFFAPPTTYDEPAEPAVPQAVPEVEMAPQVGPESEDERRPPPPTIAPAAADDDWAAWSAAPAASDDPYARRQALSRSTGPSESESRYQNAVEPQRPLQAAQESPVSRPPPAFVSNTAQAALPAPTFRKSDDTQVSMDRMHHIPEPQREAANPVPPPSAPAPSVPVSIAEAQAKAKAIAARLAAMGKLGSGAPAPAPAPPASTAYPPPQAFPMPPFMPPLPGADEPIPGLGSSMSTPPHHIAASAAPAPAPSEPVRPENFASNLMSKYGWSQGQGLGATSQGMLNPLMLSSGTDGKKGKGKQQSAGQQQQQPVSKVTGMATAKGRVISDLKTEKDRAEKERYGEPSRIVLLTNVCLPHEVDEDLVSDMSEEARKCGILERCVMRVLPGLPAEESVRVFLAFSGLVGAWKAVKEFDGRYFGGRTLVAKFFDEPAFRRGDFHS